MQIIYCDTFEAFMDAIESLTKKGLTFDANTDKLTIKLTGGYWKIVLDNGQAYQVDLEPSNKVTD